MKTYFFIIFVLLYSNLSSQEYSLNSNNSKVYWKAYKIGGSHEGTINIKASEFRIQNDSIRGATIIMDMNTIQITDLNSESSREKLMDVFEAPSFFNIENFPTSTFTFNSSEKGTIKGNIKIKDKIKSVVFPINYKPLDDKITIAGVIKLDRQDFNIIYDEGFFSSIGDKVIKDEFEIKFNLELNKN